MKKKIRWDRDTGPRRLRQFLEIAYCDKWLSQNFLLANLEKQFDKFIQNQTSRSSDPPVSDLEYLYERFLEGNLDRRLILPEHYVELSNKFGVSITQAIIQKRMRELLGSNIFFEMQLYEDYAKGRESKLVIGDKANLMKMAVLGYFEEIKNKRFDHRDCRTKKFE